MVWYLKLFLDALQPFHDLMQQLPDTKNIYHYNLLDLEWRFSFLIQPEEAIYESTSLEFVLWHFFHYLSLIVLIQFDTEKEIIQRLFNNFIFITTRHKFYVATPRIHYLLFISIFRWHKLITIVKWNFNF